MTSIETNKDEIDRLTQENKSLKSQILILQSNSYNKTASAYNSQITVMGVANYLNFSFDIASYSNFKVVASANQTVSLGNNQGAEWISGCTITRVGTSYTLNKIVCCASYSGGSISLYSINVNLALNKSNNNIKYSI